MQYNLADLFESIVDRVAERTALVCGAQRRTYAELEERANRLAHALQARGVGTGDHVALYLTNCAEYVEAMIACFKIRAVPLNVNFRYVEDELRYLLEDSGSAALVHHRELAPRVAAVRRALPRLRAVLAVEDGSRVDAGPAGAELYDEAIAGGSPACDFAPRSPDDLYVIYTGGTTGMPKGVMWRQEDWFFTGMMGGNPMGPPPEKPEEVAERAAEKAPQAVMSAAPLIHGAGQLGVWIAMLQGFKACLVPRFDPALVWKAVHEERPISLSIVGDAMARPLAEALDDARPDWDLSSLLVLSSAGAILSQPVREQLRRHFPNLVIMDNFGSSETGSHGSDAGGARPEGGIRFRMNAHTVILDDDGNEVPEGEIGKVALRGRVPVGYWNDAEKSARTFVEYGGVRHVLIGDFARREPDGTVTVFGRGSQCINSGGEKIFPEEVEGALKSHPDVFDALVVGIPDARWGEKVAAVVQARSGRRPPADEVIAHCRKQLAGYKAPRLVHFVDQIARSPSGKADYPWAKRVAVEAAGAGR
jgi:acyl-CoA synthetase (AMP-forming)/AMP-acid ligase II